MKQLKTIVFSASLFLLFFISSCKGRTMENMEPNGDTVEVVINNLPIETDNETEVAEDSTVNPITGIIN